MSQRLATTAFALLLVLPPLEARQPLPPRLADPFSPAFDEELYDNPRLARARFEADQADAAALGRARLAAAQVVFQARQQELLAGRLTVFELLDSVQLQLQADLDVQGQDGTAAVLEVAWRQCCEIEAIVEKKYQSNTCHFTDLLIVRETRLTLQQARARLPRAGRVAGSLDDFVRAEDPLELAQHVARLNFEAEQTPRPDVDRARVETARRVYAERQQEVLSGRGWVSDLLEESQRLLQAELAARGEDGAVAALELRWRQAREIETILQAKFLAGTAKVADLTAARCTRLEAETALLRARRAHSGARVDIALDLVPEDDDFLERHKELARARFQAEQTSPAERAHERYDAAHLEVEARVQELMAGRITLDLLLESTHRLFQAQRDLGGEAELAPVLESVWRIAWYTETIFQAKLAAGTAKIADTYHSTEHRLEVERQLSRLKERPKR
jgi:hypothetical protein